MIGRICRIFPTSRADFSYDLASAGAISRTAISGHAAAMGHLRQAAAVTRVVLIHPGQDSGEALAEWLRDATGAEVHVADCVGAGLAEAVHFSPQAIVLDLQTQSGTTANTIRLFKDGLRSLRVFILAHESSESLERRCRAAGVDGVFGRTTQLEELARCIRGMPASPGTDQCVPP